MREARFSISFEDSERLVLLDVGPWDQYPTITNDAEGVVERVVRGESGKGLGNRRLFYVDSEGLIDELLVRDGKFAGFKAGVAPIFPQ